MSGSIAVRTGEGGGGVECVVVVVVVVVVVSADPIALAGLSARVGLQRRQVSE